MNPDDLRDRDRVVKLLRRRGPVELRVKPSTPELMDGIVGGMRAEYDGASEQRAVHVRELFNGEAKP